MLTQEHVEETVWYRRQQEFQPSVLLTFKRCYRRDAILSPLDQEPEDDCNESA